ncbi:DnaB-like helicase N-terminal domain-containing protein [Streptomyces sp. SID13726]|uniref:DnaB-like helicase N-terminal domain-containing protein n=1 Tax=Streptomyces sp. SID13726 TaxID=2706058 RepID=UPI0013BC3634|nr:DnaB-like helicase N-terminal domain-containing protein [Streptomyces sp. SID13726]NEB01994.1 replicative DNA helicase [Streptomyces sp. SID13726]
MPHTPDTPDITEDDDLDRVRAALQPVHYAEQALLGALLLDPQRLADTTTLTAGHFDNHNHATLFTAIRTLPTPDPADHAKDAAWLTKVLEHARPKSRSLSSSYLHSLIQFCPQPKHAAAYARMIRADHARRTLSLHAERLALTATDPAGPDTTAATLAHADTLARLLDDLAGQFAPHPGSLPRTPPAPTAARHGGEEDLYEERCLLATATAYPAEVAQMRWLAAEDFIWPLHATLWQCITALVHRGDMVDPVTVLSEAQHRGLITDTLTSRDLIALISTPAASPEYWGENVLRRALLARAHTVATRITTYTDDLANTPHQLITGSRRALADLNSLRTRWHHATSPALATRSAQASATAAPRAGPPPATTPPAVRLSR